MAPPKISEEQWLQLEPRVKELFRQHIPLKCKDGSRLTIPDILAREFHLSVTISQLEAKLKTWNVAKKLKLHEWKTVMPHLDRLRASGTKYRLFLAGQQIKESAIQRAKRALKSRGPGVESHGAGSLQSTNELDVRHISIMIPSDDGNQWVPYRGTEAGLTRSPSRPPAFGAEPGTDAPPSAPVSTDMVLFSPHIGPPGTHATGRHQGLSPRIQDWSTTPAFSGALGSTASNDLFLDLELSRRVSSPLGSFHASPMPLRIDRHPSPITCPRTHPNHIPGISQPVDVILSSQHILSSDALFGRVPGLLHSILQRAADLSEKPPLGRLARQQLPEVEVLLDRLLAVLPRIETERVMKLSTEATGSELLVREMFLHSIVNNFAGLQDLPPKGILSVLRNDSQMIPELSKRLSGCSQALAKTIADNLFRVAVEARDARTTELIFTAVSGQPYAIDLDGFICRHEEENYSHLELAAKHYDVGMVSVLVRLGADVNRSCYSQMGSCPGPLGHAVPLVETKNPRVPRPPGVVSDQYRVVMILLEHGAKVHRSHLSDGLDLAEPEIPIALMERFDRHCEVNWQHIAWPSLAWQSDHQRTAWFRRLLALCAKFGCNKCIGEFRLALALAALSGHLELCRTLIHHGVTVTPLAHAWAIRGGHPDVVDLMREQGIDTTLPLHEQLEVPPGLYSISQPPDTPYNYRENTTPLAEAIRCRDVQLAEILERLGAWRRVQESAEHFEAAAIAASEVGDLLCLRRVLDTIPNFKGLKVTSIFHEHYSQTEFPAAFLTMPLIAAIRNQERQAIVMLMDAGAQESTIDTHNHVDSALCEAIRQRNRPLVSRILETDVCFRFPRFDKDATQRQEEEGSPLSLAVRWGDVSLVRDILQMHADFPLHVALLEAVRSNNKELVELLQEQSAAVCNGDILLEATKFVDTEMIKLLLSRELRSLDSRGFQGLMEADSPNLEIVLEMLKERSPRAVLDCGHVLLIHAIQANNHKAIRTLLASPLDINGLDSGVGLNPLGCAIENASDLRAIRLLIDMGADVNTIVALPNGIGRASKFDQYTVWPRETALLVAIKVDKRDVVALLLEKGANVNHAARLGVKRTPLQAACERGSWGIVQLLLENGADPNAPPALKGGGTALQLAAMGDTYALQSTFYRSGPMYTPPRPGTTGVLHWRRRPKADG